MDARKTSTGTRNDKARPSFSARVTRQTVLPWLFTAAVLAGCNSLTLRSQSPEEIDVAASEGAQLVGDLAVPYGLHTVTVESPGLVTGLPDTGSDPPNSPERAMLLHEMQSRNVESPNQVLASPTTDLVMVRAFLRPGIQKGDRFDVEVRVPSRSENVSLRGGWLMETRLRELAVYEARIREGRDAALVQGPLLVDPSADASNEENHVSLGRARILGGGVALVSRPLGLVLKPESRNVRISALVGTAVNRRFPMFTHGVREDVATPKDDKYVELKVHPRYKDNIERYMRVVRSIPVRETAPERMTRIGLLRRQLLDPITSANAALRLEAIGKEGIPALHEGLASDDREVRFYAAEALAYLDERDAAQPLAAAAAEVPAFRAFALAALSAMDDYAATEALRGLLDVPSAETRYGAFRALWAMNSHDPIVEGEMMADQFSYHVLEVGGPPMIHLTRSYRPEVVLFGRVRPLATPLLLEAGNEIMVTSRGGNRITVSRFAVGKPDQKRDVPATIDAAIRAVVDVGGTYPDVVQMLQQAKSKGLLSGRLEVEAIPSAGRTYEREATVEAEGETAAEVSGIVVANPLPGLFARRQASAETGSNRSTGDDLAPDLPEQKGRSHWPFFGRMGSDSP